MSDPTDLDELDRLRSVARERPSAGTITDWYGAVDRAYPALAAELRELRREVAAPLAFDLQSWLEANLRRCAHGYLHLSCGDCLGWRKQ